MLMNIYCNPGGSSEIPVASIEISGDASGNIGTYITLSATVLPEDATNKAVLWTVTEGSDYVSIVSQDSSTCIVECVSEGVGTITATAQDGSGVSATHQITSIDPTVYVTGITIEGATEGDLGTYVTLTASVTPDDATNKAVSWEITGGSEYITISSQTESSCIIYCQSEGTGTVRATAQDGSGIYADHQVTAVDPTVYVTGITISGDTEGDVGDTVVLTATVTPTTATYPAVAWSITSGGEYASIVSYTDSTCTLELTDAGTVVVTATSTDGTQISTTHTIAVSEPASTATITIDTTMMLTDPTEAVQYTDTSLSPVLNESTSLATATSEGSWGFDRTTGMDRNGLFYATFQEGSSGQYLHQLLDPYDLTQYIALWDDDSKSWDYSQTGSSSITSENTMLCIPRAFIEVSNDSLLNVNVTFDMSIETLNDARPYAHTIDGTVYDYLAIGVYLGYTSSSILRSWSGVTATRSTTIANFRTYAGNNTVRNGHAMLWNFWHWDLWKTLTYIRIKSFNAQEKVGWGGLSYSSSTTGLCNALGPFAGNVSSTGNAVKCLIENGWYSVWQYIDDIYYSASGQAVVGTNSVPVSSTSDKDVTISYSTSNGGYGGAVTGNAVGWSMPADITGSSTTGTCDYFYGLTSSLPFALVGGSSNNASSDCGPGDFYNSAGSSGTGSGSRLAFVFNA